MCGFNTQEQTVPNNKKINCYYCGNEMLADAKVCISCQHYKSKYLNWIRIISSGTASVMVIVAFAQLILAIGEKIDTNKMLEEIKGVKADAEIVFKDIKHKESLINNRFDEINKNIDLLDRKYIKSMSAIPGHLLTL